MPDSLEFRVSSGLKDIIGKDLITDDFIAVFELVKNSYDAHAKNVSITFENGKIIITDDGKGMSLQEIKEKWLFVAYSAKKDGTEDNQANDEKKKSYRDRIKAKRQYAGAKGIGRFSADRLGSSLVLTTRKSGESKFEKITINWDDFNNQDEEFETIKVLHESLANCNIPFPKGSNNGLILEIYGTSIWERKRIIQLKHSLEKLINPFDEGRDFNINITCEAETEEDNRKDSTGKYIHVERNQVNGPIKNSILGILDLKTTQIEVKIRTDKITSKVFDRGTLIYHISEDNNDFGFLTESNIDLYYLNQAAKNNFTRNMGVQPVNFGSVFLFKNGFRVQPFGEVGDDSWGLDYRAQQGYNRRLGTRNLFGRVEIITDNFKEFREVSSRDGGLIETFGYHQLMNAFMEKGLKRLERYVVGVLWGEAFKRRNYFGEGEEAEELAEAQRKELQSKDKLAEDFSVVTGSIGSKIDFIQLIKSLSSDKDITIHKFNKDLVDLVNERLSEAQTKFISDLEKIAEQVDDNDLRKIIDNAEKKYQELKKEKEEAERKARKEELRRIAAEKRAHKEAKAREEAERRRKEEEEKRRQAELATLKKEKERVEAENARLKAEKIARQEEDARKKAESSLKHEQDKNTYLAATRKTLSEDAEDLIHSIKVSSIGIETGLDNILERLRSEKLGDNKLLEEIGSIKFINDKVKKLSMLVTKSSFKADQEVKKVNVAKYIQEYIETYSYAYSDKIKLEFQGQSSFISRISVLDLSIVIDNLISNAVKAGARKILVEIVSSTDKLEVLFHDGGSGVIKEFVESPKEMFELGAKSNIEGSGIGLSTVKKKMQEMYGDIKFVGNGHKLKGATFKLVFK